MKKLFLLFPLCLCMTAFLFGCGTETEEPTETTEPTKEVVATDTIDETELYQKFLNNEMEATIHTEYFGENENLAIDAADVELINSYGDVGYENSREIGEALTFSDLEQYVQDEYGEDGGTGYSCVSYAYITCGGSEHESLVVQFSGVSSLFFVVNEENGVLYLTYSLASWDRCNVELTSNGLLSGTGSSSAGNVHIWTSVLDANAVQQVVVDADTYSGTWIMDLDALCDVYQEIFGDESAPLSITKYEIGDTICYTYEMEDGASSESDEIDSLLSSSGLTWCTEDEINSLIAERKEALQIPSSVFDDTTAIEWITLEMNTPETSASESAAEEAAPVEESKEENSQNYSLVEYFDMTLDELTSVLGEDYQCMEWDGCWRVSYDDYGYFLFEQQSPDGITGSEEAIYMEYALGWNSITDKITPTISGALYYSDIVNAGIASEFDYVDTSGNSMESGLIYYSDDSGHLITFVWGGSDPYSDPVDGVDISRE